MHPLLPHTFAASRVLKSRKRSDLILLQGRSVARIAFIVFSVGVVLPFSVFSQIRLDVEHVHTGKLN